MNDRLFVTSAPAYSKRKRYIHACVWGYVYIQTRYINQDVAAMDTPFTLKHQEEQFIVISIFKYSTATRYYQKGK